jgi:hypothetical protein
MFAALNTVEPPILDRGIAILLERDKTWHEERLPILEDRVRVRLGELSRCLGNADWLDDAFSAGDLLMVTVLRRLSGSGILEKYSNLCAYVARGEARPAYKRAFDAQLAAFTYTRRPSPWGTAATRSASSCGSAQCRVLRQCLEHDGISFPSLRNTHDGRAGSTSDAIVRRAKSTRTRV